MGLVVTSVGDISTVVDEDPTPEVSEAEEAERVAPVPPRDVPLSRVSAFATGEIGRLNSILGSGISNLELALSVIPDSLESSPEAEGRQAVAEALDACRQLAEFQRILARLDSMRTASRHEQGITGCLDEAAARADVRGVTIVRNYSSVESELAFDRQRITQAGHWLIKAIAVAILSSATSSRQRIISVGYEAGEDPLITIGQTVLSFDDLMSGIEKNLTAHWYFEAAKIALAWEGFTVGNVEGREFSGFKATRIELDSSIGFGHYLR